MDARENPGLCAKVTGCVVSSGAGGLIGGFIGYSIDGAKEAAVVAVCLGTAAFGVEYSYQPIATGFQRIFGQKTPSQASYRNETIAKLDRLVDR